MTQRSIEPETLDGVSSVADFLVMPDRLMPHAGLSWLDGHPVIARLGRALPRLVLAGAIGLLLVALALLIFRVAFSDRIYPAVVVGDVDVGGLTVEEAIGAIEQRAADMEAGTIAFTHDGRTWTPTLTQLGASVDIESSVDAAWELGRDDSAVSRLGFTSELIRQDQMVPLRTTVDRAALNSWFDRVDADLDQRAVDATLVLDGTTVTIERERAGVIVDREAATAMVLGALGRLDPISEPLPTMVEQPQLVAADLENERASLQQSLNSPIVATFEDRKWDLAPADLARFVHVDVQAADGAARVDLAMDRSALSSWLREQFAGEVNRSPVDARIAWQWDVGLVATEPSVSGAALRADAFAEGVETAFLEGTGRVDIPVIVTAPEIDSNNLEALKINTRLARGDSNYGGQSRGRDTNIEVATGYLTGELIRPGEEFSFNKAIGEIDQSRGFVESGVILNGRASRGDGGGVCQVSTTVFRAAILAGLEVTDWEEHTQRLLIYERDGWTAGYDASILQWGDDPALWGDLRFRNDTGGYMLIQAWNEYPYNIVEIYGNDDGREVEVSDASIWEGTSYPDDVEVVDSDQPAGTIFQSEWPRTPMETLFTVTVTYADGTVRTQEFFSRYHGSGNVWTVSPDMQGQSPAAG